MRTYNQNPDGSGNGPWSDLINRILKRLTELEFFSTDTVRVEQTLRGVRFHAARQNGSGGIAGWAWATVGTGAHYAVDKNYKGAPPQGDIVIVFPNDPIVVTGVTDPDSGLLVSAVPGVYICIQSTGPLVNPAGLPAGTYDHIPQWPMPSKDYDITNKLNFWWLINEISAC